MRSPRPPGPRDHGRPQPGPPGLAGRGGALAHGALLEPQRQPEVRPERAAIIALYTTPPEATIVICADELGPVIPRTFPPPPGWSTDGHRIKAPLDYARGPERTWVYGALRVRDGEAVTLTAPSRNSVGYQQLLAAVEQANPTGELAVITDNLASHSSFSTRAWLAEHPRIRQVFIPVGACWLNLQEAWWRLFRRAALAGQSFACPTRSPSPPRSRPANSTPVPAPGSGAVHDPHHATGDASSPTEFKTACRSF